MAKRLTQKEAEDICTEKGFKLLSQYENAKEQLSYICKCGRKCENTIRTIKKMKSGCKFCAIENSKLPLDKVKDIFATNGCTFLDEEYNGVNSSVNYQCKCGRTAKTTIGQIRRGSLCWECGKVKTRLSQLEPYEKIKEDINLKGYDVLTLEEDYIKNNKSIKIKCQQCGDEYSTSIYRFRNLWGGCQHNGSKNRKNGKDHFLWKEDRAAMADYNHFADKCRKMIWACFKSFGKQKTEKTYSLLGYTPTELMNHIQSLPNWESLKDTGYHIDHILPINAFKDYNIFDLKIINCLENLNILPGFDNIAKGGRYDKENFEEWLTRKSINFIS